MKKKYQINMKTCTVLIPGIIILGARNILFDAQISIRSKVFKMSIQTNSENIPLFRIRLYCNTRLKVI